MKINLRNGRNKVSKLNVRDISIIGKLAIHIMFGTDELYTITHLPTGAAIRHYLTKMQAITIVNRVSQFDWDFDDPYKMPETTKDQLSDVLKDVLYPEKE